MKFEIAAQMWLIAVTLGFRFPVPIETVPYPDYVAKGRKKTTGTGNHLQLVQK